MSAIRYSVIIFFCCVPFFGNAQVQPQATDTAKYILAAKDTAKFAPVVIAPPLTPPALDTNIHLYEAPVVKNTVQKLYDYQRYSHGASPGFRVQIDFSQDRNSVNNTKSTFTIRYPGVTSYVTYKQPYFRVSVGDFRTKLEAVSFLKMVKKNYPAAFVVADKIIPPPL
jgi:hypothetical protein